MDIKQKLANKALGIIGDKKVVGLGGGSTILVLADLIKQNNLDISIVSPSYTTIEYCLSIGLNVLDLSFVSHVDIAFDSCDECDENFYALKSGGGIHTMEKLVANMADEYIILVSNEKYSKNIIFKVPIVVEVIPKAYKYTVDKIKNMGYDVKKRAYTYKDSFVYSDCNNILLEVMPNTNNLCEIYNNIKNIYGVIELSLFNKEITGIILEKYNDVVFIKK